MKKKDANNIGKATQHQAIVHVNSDMKYGKLNELVWEWFTVPDGLQTEGCINLFVGESKSCAYMRVNTRFQKSISYVHQYIDV